MTWTKENLKMTYFSDGTPIVMAKNEEDWINYFHAEIPCWRYYQYDANQDPRLGLEYNMYVIMHEKELHLKAGECLPSMIGNILVPISAIGMNCIFPMLFLPKPQKTEANNTVLFIGTAVIENMKAASLSSRAKINQAFLLSLTVQSRITKKAVDRNDNNKAVWWAMTPKKIGSKFNIPQPTIISLRLGKTMIQKWPLFISLLGIMMAMVFLPKIPFSFTGIS